MRRRRRRQRRQLHRPLPSRPLTATSGLDFCAHPLCLPLERGTLFQTCLERQCRQPNVRESRLLYWLYLWLIFLCLCIIFRGRHLFFRVQMFVRYVEGRRRLAGAASNMARLLSNADLGARRSSGACALLFYAASWTLPCGSRFRKAISFEFVCRASLFCCEAMRMRILCT